MKCYRLLKVGTSEAAKECGWNDPEEMIRELELTEEETNSYVIDSSKVLEINPKMTHGFTKVRVLRFQGGLDARYSVDLVHTLAARSEHGMLIEQSEADELLQG